MDENKRQEIKDKVLELWDGYGGDATQLTIRLEHYYIFGTLDLDSQSPELDAPTNEHYLRDELRAIVIEVYTEKNPPIESPPEL